MATRLTMRGVNPGDAVGWTPSLQTSYHGIYTQEQDLVRGVTLPEWTRLEIAGTFSIMSEVQRGSVKSYWGMVWTELDDQQRGMRSVDGSGLLCGMKEVAVIP